MGIVNNDYANSLNTNPHNMMVTQQTRMGIVNQDYMTLIVSIPTHKMMFTQQTRMGIVNQHYRMIIIISIPTHRT